MTPLLLTLSGACAAPAPPPLPDLPPVEWPAAETVDRIVFLVGDPGKAMERQHPILRHLKAEVERWSDALARDSAVIVLVLGDVVYPDGMHDHDDREDFPRDSLMVADQIEIVSGPAARRHHTPMFFIAGNHDWGQETKAEGAARLENLERFLDAFRRTGPNVRLLPAAGEPGPVLVDAGPRLRLVLLDTAWWLLESRGTKGQAMLDGVERAIASANGRHVVLVAHHPFRSGGPHGGELSFLEELGVGYVLKRSGAILQDLNSPPYRRLRSGLREAFARAGAPLLYAAGHEHSLQLLRGLSPDEPRYSAVSGSASKITPVGTEDGMLFSLSATGYLALVIRQDGSAQLYAVAAPPEYLTCPAKPADAWERCMREGTAAFRPRIVERLGSSYEF